jgi:hypothetical protein
MHSVFFRVGEGARYYALSFIIMFAAANYFVLKFRQPLC